VTKKK